MTMAPMRIDEVFVELTSRCNFDCPYCPNHSAERRCPEMGPAVFNNLISQLQNISTLKIVHLWLLGEPFCHPQIAQYTSALQAAALPFDLVSNGSLVDPEKLPALLECRPAAVFLSVQDPTPSHFALRSQIPFERYVEQLRRTIAAFQNFIAGTEPTTKLCIKFLVRNDPRLFPDTPFLQTTQDFKGLRTFLKRIVPHLPQDIMLPESRDNLKYRAEYPLCRGVSAVFDSLGVWGSWPLPGRTLPSRCPNPNQIGILCDGRVVLCCLDFQGATSFGNIQDTSLLELIAKARREEYMLPQVCGGCESSSH